ncbi:MAG: DUF1592 domain-containing protein [Bdellovibrionaceae bacterium]|nr:DUF1592 domain-containing protein [Pseudobdellovibrionaceae bacterium]
MADFVANNHLDGLHDSAQVMIQSPEADSYLRNQIQLKGTCSKTMAVDIAGDITQPAEVPCVNGEFSADLELTYTDGAKNVRIQAVSDPTAVASRSFIRDTVAPDLNILSPAASLFTKNPVVVQGTCESGTDVVLTEAGSTYSLPCSSANTFATTLTLKSADGAVTLNLSQTDKAGNIAQKSVNITKDTVAPAVQFATPAANATVQSPLNVSGTCSNDGDVTLSGSGLSGSLISSCQNGQFMETLNLTSGNGAKMISASQTDKAGNVGTVSLTVQRLDTAAPVIAITGPAANSATKSTVALQGTCTDGLTVTVGGMGATATTTSCSSGSFSVTVTLSGTDGSKNVTVSQVDSLNRTGMDSRNFVKDAAPPILSINAPDALTATKSAIALSGSCESGQEVTITGGTQTLKANCVNSAFSSSVTLTSTDGTKTISVAQSDAVGNSSTASRQFVLDTKSPVVAVSSPASGAIVQGTVTVSGSCETGIPVEISGTGVSSTTTTNCANSAFSTSVVLSSGDGTKALVISQTDAPGNKGSVNLSLVRQDTTPQYITITGPAANSLVQNSVVLQGTCTNGYQIKVSGAGVAASSTGTCSSGAFSLTLTLSSNDGSKSIIVSQTDAQNRTASDTRTFIKDATAPRLAINSPAEGTVTKSIVALSGSCEAGLTVSLAGGAQTSTTTCASGTFSATATLTAGDGAKVVSVSQTDAAGNTGSATRSFTLDTTAPNLTFSSPALNATVQSPVAVTGACETNLPVIITGAGVAMSATVNCASSAFTASVSLTEGNGSKTVTLTQTDAAGNVTSVSRALNRQDIPPPAIAITSPAANSVTKNGTLSISGTCTANLSIAVSGSGVTSGTATCAAAGTFTATITFTSGDGNKSVTVTQTDSQSRVASDSRIFVKDSTAPVLAITSPSANTATKNNIVMMGTCETGLAITLTGATSSNLSCSNGAFSANIGLSGSDGSKTVTIAQTDAAGNTGNASRAFTLDTAPPALSITSPAANSSSITGLTLTGACESGLNVSAGGTGVMSSVSTTCAGSAYSLAILFSASEGTKDVTVTSTDAAGNTASVSRSFVRVAPVVDGATLYAQNCASCHGALVSTAKPGRSPSQITAAINTLTQMQHLKGLTADQISKISTALGYNPNDVGACQGTRVADTNAVFKMNKEEYVNTVGDLFGAPASVVEGFLPENDVETYANTVSHLLNTPEAQIEQYLVAAEKVVAHVWTNNKSLVMTCTTPATNAATCAGNILDAWGPRLFRRPLETAERTSLLGMIKTTSGVTTAEFEEGVKTAVTAMLFSPNFIYRTVSSSTGVVKTLDQYELAARLSYFLWSSTPDDTLYAAAKAGTLKSGLKAQITRMLESPKAKRLTQNFATRWIGMGLLAKRSPDTTVYPAFNASLRSAFETETTTFFDNLFTQKRSLIDILSADYTYVNAQLAQHYGISGVTGTNFRQVSLTNTPRRGITSHASFLTMTSHPDDSSVIARGKWIMQNLMCDPPPAPPPDASNSTIDIDPSWTKRQKMEAHRNNPSCFSCHSRMEPLGFGLENYDGIGAFRTTWFNQGPVDNAGTLPNGVGFSSSGELAQYMNDSKTYGRCAAKQMVSFAVGRVLNNNDDCNVRDIADTTIVPGKTVVDTVEAIVNNAIFSKVEGK